jgi:hypothetical protein
MGLALGLVGGGVLTWLYARKAIASVRQAAEKTLAR